MLERRIGLLGLGHAVPRAVRTNDDPVFDELRAAARDRESATAAEAALFTGLKNRRVLLPSERLEDMMALAARNALEDANSAPADIDRLYGYASPPDHLTPNGLYLVHHKLGLARSAPVLPINCEFSNFIFGTVLAWEAIVAGRCGQALVVCGAGWTRCVDYKLAHAASVGDGAGAAVVGPSDRMLLLDSIAETQSDDYETMTLAARPIGDAFSRPTYAITEGGRRAFVERGMTTPPRLVSQLLSRNGIAADRVALVTHQASRVLLDAWRNGIQPRQHLDTFEEFGNVTLASLPITLSAVRAEITAEYIVCASAGTGANFAAMLIRR